LLVFVRIISGFARCQLINIHDLKTRIRETRVKLIAKISVICGRKFNILFIILAPLMAFSIYFVNE